MKTSTNEFFPNYGTYIHTYVWMHTIHMHTYTHEYTHTCTHTHVHTHVHKDVHTAHVHTHVCIYNVYMHVCVYPHCQPPHDRHGNTSLVMWCEQWQHPVPDHVVTTRLGNGSLRLVLEANSVDKSSCNAGQQEVVLVPGISLWLGSLLATGVIVGLCYKFVALMFTEHMF